MKAWRIDEQASHVLLVIASGGCLLQLTGLLFVEVHGWLKKLGWDVLWYFISMTYKWIIDHNCICPTLKQVFSMVSTGPKFLMVFSQEFGLQSNVVHRNLLLSAYERLSHWQHAIAELRNLRDCTLEARIDEDDK